MTKTNQKKRDENKEPEFSLDNILGNNPGNKVDGFALFDTGAFINLYHQYGVEAILNLGKNENLIYSIPGQVLEELQEQYENRRFSVLSDEQCEEFGVRSRTPKVPYELINAIYELIGNDELMVEEVNITPERDQEIRAYMAAGNIESGNTRIGKGDIGLIALAQDLGDSVIVSPDSDLPSTLGAAELPNVLYINESGYAEYAGLDSAA